MRASPPPADADAPSLRSIVEGLRYAGSRPELLGTYLVDINAMLFGMPQALFPAIADELRRRRGAGAAAGRAAVGSLVVALFSGWTRHVHRHGRAVALAATGWGVAIVAFGFTNVLWLALACLAVAGAMDAISGLFRSVIWNETIPDRLRGRLAGVEMISYTSGPTLGNFEAGALASLTSVRTSVVSGGVLCVAGTAVLVALLPAFWRYDARQEVGGRPPAAAAPLLPGYAGPRHEAALARAVEDAVRAARTGAPAADTRARWPAAEALALAAVALPASLTLIVFVLALPPAGVKVTLSTYLPALALRGSLSL